LEASEYKGALMIGLIFVAVFLYFEYRIPPRDSLLTSSVVIQDFRCSSNGLSWRTANKSPDGLAYSTLHVTHSSKLNSFKFVSKNCNLARVVAKREHVTLEHDANGKVFSIQDSNSVLMTYDKTVEILESRRLKHAQIFFIGVIFSIVAWFSAYGRKH